MPWSGLMGISVFLSGLCLELLDDTNECQYILLHEKINPQNLNPLNSFSHARVGNY